MVTLYIVNIISVIFLILTQEFGGIMMMSILLKLVICPKVFILERVTKKTKKRSVRLKKNTVCGLYQNKPSDSIQPYLFQEFSNVSKMRHIKKVMQNLNIFRKFSIAGKDISDKIQTGISFIKDNLQHFIELTYSVKNKMENFFVEQIWTKQILIMNRVGKKLEKGKQHQIMSHIWLITKYVCFNVENFTH